MGTLTWHNDTCEVENLDLVSLFNKMLPLPLSQDTLELSKETITLMSHPGHLLTCWYERQRIWWKGKIKVYV